MTHRFGTALRDTLDKLIARQDYSHRILVFSQRDPCAACTDITVHCTYGILLEWTGLSKNHMFLFLYSLLERRRSLRI